jgi:hypothetical protein
VGFFDLEPVDRIAVQVMVAFQPCGRHDPDDVHQRLLPAVREGSHPQFVRVAMDGQGVPVFGAMRDA